MSKGKHGNKEAKKPKQVAPVVKPPVTGAALPVPAVGSRPSTPRK
jgi:hypothetical protein